MVVVVEVEVVLAVDTVGKSFILIKLISSMNIVPCAKFNAVFREKSTLS